MATLSDAGDKGPRRVAVVTDSTTYLPREMLAGLGVREVDLYVGWAGEHRPESEYDLADFYARLREDADLPSTSQPSVGDFLSVYEPLVEAGQDVVSVHIAAGLSGTCASAIEAGRQLAERGLPGRVEVVDAETGAAGLGGLVIAAARAAEGGADREAVVAAAREARRGLQMWFCLDTLEYLRKGGRIGAAQALVGSALKIKPILTFGTEIAPVGKVRTRRRAMQRMAEYLVELRELGAEEWFIQHAQSPEEAAALVSKGIAVLGSEPLFCTEVGPVLGAHLGSGVLVGGTGCRPTG